MLYFQDNESTLSLQAGSNGKATYRFLCLSMLTASNPFQQVLKEATKYQCLRLKDLQLTCLGYHDTSTA